MAMIKAKRNGHNGKVVNCSDHSFRCCVFHHPDIACYECSKWRIFFPCYGWQVSKGSNVEQTINTIPCLAEGVSFNVMSKFTTIGTLSVSGIFCGTRLLLHNHSVNLKNPIFIKLCNSVASLVNLSQKARALRYHHVTNYCSVNSVLQICFSHAF